MDDYEILCDDSCMSILYMCVKVLITIVFLVCIVGTCSSIFDQTQD